MFWVQKNLEFQVGFKPTNNRVAIDCLIHLATGTKFSNASARRLLKLYGLSPSSVTLCLHICQRSTKKKDRVQFAVLLKIFILKGPLSFISKIFNIIIKYETTANHRGHL